MTASAPQLAGWLLPGLIVLVPGALYLLGSSRWRQRRGRGWSGGRTASWLVGLLLVAAALTPPVASMVHHDPRAHMAQHLLVGMYGPLALVLAAPVTLLLGVVRTSSARAVTRLLRTRVVHVLTSPAVATLLSAGGLWLLYATPLYHATTLSPVAHHLLLVHLVLSGAVFAWAVAGPDPAPRRPGMLSRVGALLVSAASHAILAKQLYGRAGEWPPGGHGTEAELQEAAMLMYYGGDLAEILLAVALLAGWYSRSAPRTTALRPAPLGG